MAQALGILGGSFDPVHNGHVVLAVEAVERLRLARLLVVPARRSPHKTGFPAAAPKVRLELLRLAFAGVPGVEVSDVELRRPEPSFTIDTIAEVARLHPDAELVLLLGLDALKDFARWKGVPQIVAACRLAVFQRPGAGQEVLFEARRALPGLRIEPLTTPLLEISSTRVRERARAGLTLAGLVPDAVRAEIARLGLYGKG
jgi:nicotinate-nucleotide adenylyltransferase